MEKSGIFSHPDIYIEDHINRCLEILNFYLQEIPLIDENLKKAIKISVALHDFGKATSFFQKYITGEGEKTEKTEHSFLSGIYTLYKVNQILKDDKLSLFSFVACKRHHTNPTNFLEEAYIPEKKIEILKKQIKSINEQAFNTFINNLNLEDDLKKELYLDKEAFLKELPNIKIKLVDFRLTLHDAGKLEDFLKFQYIYSLVLDADKTEAGAKPYTPKRHNIPTNVVFSYKSQKFKSKSKLDVLREQAFKEVLDREIDLNQRIYTLTLPTGLGKTITGFAFALKLKEELQREKNIVPRIIYALPFVSIIDQNYQVFKEILETNFQNVDSSILLKHHHLSEPAFEEFDFKVSRVLQEAWNSEIIVTTFVQLFNTLVASENGFARRFNKFANSIVIVDEVQSLPTKYWKLISEVVKEVSEKLNTYFIFMTATQPYLTQNAVELVNKEYYINQIHRYTVEIDLSEKTIEDFIQGLSLEENKTYLFIFNTVKSSKQAFNLLKEKFPSEAICYLSTNIVPFEREKRIREIKEGKYRIVVSTQLVEAGVDISFDVVYRDFAPLDSLNQSAGRCNRNMEEGKKGEFRIINLVDSKPYAYKIYDIVLLDHTKALLNDKKTLSEPEFISLVIKYFESLIGKLSDDISSELIESLALFRYKSDKNSIRDFVLIEEDKYKKDVFIHLNDEAKGVWEKAKRIVSMLKRKEIDIFGAREEFEKLKPAFFKYVISVPIRGDTPVFDRDVGMYVVERSLLDFYYDEETGYGKDKST